MNLKIRDCKCDDIWNYNRISNFLKMHLFYFILDACLGCHKSKSVHFSLFHSNTLFGELEIYFRLFPESRLGISDMHNHEAGKLIQSRNLIPHIFEAFLLLHKKVIDWNSKPNSWNFKVNWKINFWRLNMIFRLTSYFIHSFKKWIHAIARKEITNLKETYFT